MMTILHTESSMGWGGQESRTLMECSGLKELGSRVIILCQPKSMLEKRALEKGIEVKTIRMKKSYDIFAIKFIIELVKKEKIDIISTHSGKDSLLAGIAGRLSQRKPKIVRTRHLALPITTKLTYSFLPHKIVTVSNYVRQYLISEGISEEKIVAIPTGIDINRFNPEKVQGKLKQELGQDSEVFLVGTIAILRRKKGHHILLNAIPLILKEIPNVRFVFVGDGPQKENILDQIKQLGLSDKVFLLGLRNDIPDILKSINVFVLPTLQEALGTSFLEAMAMEKPVIGTNVGGVSEIIKNGINGYIVEPNNPSALANAIIKTLNDKEKADLMGKEGRKIVEQNYTVENMCEKMYALYSSLLKDKKS